MRVLHLCNDYFNTSLYQSFLRSLDETAIDELKSDFAVLTNIDDDHDDSANVFVSNIFRKTDRYFYKYKRRKSLATILSKIDINAYDMVHAHFLFVNGGVALRLKEKFGVPYIVAVRNTDVNVFFKFFIHLRHIGLRILLEAERVVFLSRAYRDFVIDKYVTSKHKNAVLQKCVVIPNGIDEFWFENLGAIKNKLEGKTIHLLQVGDINNNKNVETTVNAVQMLINEGQDVRLDLVGKIVQREIFDRIAKYSFVNYRGHKRKEELIEIYRENDIFILPSIHETFGLVYAEAMSQGLPVIYSRGQGFDKQFADGKVGYSVDASDCQDVAKKIVLASANIAELSINSLQLCKTFLWSSIAEEYGNLYKVVTEGKVKTDV